MGQPDPTLFRSCRIRSALAVAGVLLLTAAATWALGRAGHRADATRHATLTEELCVELGRRFERHEHGLRGLRAAYANGELTRAGFRRPVASFPPEEVCPAAVGLGYAARVDAAGRAEALRGIRLNAPPGLRAPPAPPAPPGPGCTASARARARGWPSAPGPGSTRRRA